MTRRGEPASLLKEQVLGPRSLPGALHGFLSGEQITKEMLGGRPGQASKQTKKEIRKKHRKVYRNEAAARIFAQITARASFYERLVAFWGNHFTVSVLKPRVLGLAGAFEREAIRPHVTGRFYDLLVAVYRHQAMLIYLDNIMSIGPRSILGRRRRRGLNENLAREVLELHTLGVDGGYSQGDVVSLAKILTGWTIERNENHERFGRFNFRERWHEPGPKLFLGRRISEAGEDEGKRALRLIATHPSTARHIAFKLARHFVADDPPKPVVDRLAAVFLDTGGDLQQVADTLVDLPDAWEVPFAKFKTPNEYVVSVLRLIGYEPGYATAGELFQAITHMGQKPFAAPSPAGWPDIGAFWASPESVLRRIEWANVVAQKSRGSIDPLRIADEGFGELLSGATLAAVERAPTAEDGLALLLASPEAMRR